MADPRWLDPTVDPNERAPGTCYLGDPQVVNNSPVGLARFCTLRSWLSQWSYDDANGDAVKCGPDIAVPALVIGNLADDACTPSHTRRLFEAIGHPDKEMHEIPGANHYYSGPDQREHAAARPSASARTGCTGTGSRLGASDDRQCTGPLDGIRVIEVGTLISGPFAGRLLGDMGAEVIKIEPPGAPDPLRTWGQAELDGHHFFWTVHARNKKAVTLNLREAAGRDLFLDLVERSDIIVENFRPGHAGEVGPRLRRAAARNKGIILVRVSGYGQTGPEAHKAGYASVAEAASGLRHMNGFPGGPPPRLALSLGDSLAGHVRRAGRAGRAVPAHRHRRGPDRRRRADRILSGRAGIDHSRLRRRRCGPRPVGHPARRHRAVEHLPAPPTAAGW